MTIFKLPDLGEGLAEAEIVEWLVKEGDQVHEDQHLVSVETAKAVVDVPSPFHGVIKKLYGNPGDTIAVGSPLIEFVSEAASASHTVAGQLEVGNTVIEETAQIRHTTSAVNATPAIRALAQHLQVDLNKIIPTGPQNSISRDDVLKASSSSAPTKNKDGLHGTRRAMAQVMANAHAQVVPVSIFEDANISAWPKGTDITIRVIRALVKACQAEPHLNAAFDGHSLQVQPHLHLGLAIDTPDGLFVPVLRDVDQCVATPTKVREMVEGFRKAVEQRAIKPHDMQGATFTLSNFGIFTGRYATTVIVPPQVGILATGKIRDTVLVIDGEVKVQRVMPLSLTFDHRAATGGEGSRFLGAIIQDLALEK